MKTRSRSQLPRSKKILVTSLTRHCCFLRCIFFSYDTCIFVILLSKSLSARSRDTCLLINLSTFDYGIDAAMLSQLLCT